MNYRNEVIRSVYKGDGSRIVKYFTALGFNTSGYNGTSYFMFGDKFYYYGVINGVFGSFNVKHVEESKAVILPMSVVDDFFKNPKANPYPKRMLVLNCIEVTIVGECRLSDGKTVYIQKNNNEYVTWCNAVDLPKVEIITMTFDEVAKRLNIDPSILVIDQCKAIK